MMMMIRCRPFICSIAWWTIIPQSTWCCNCQRQLQLRRRSLTRLHQPTPLLRAVLHSQLADLMRRCHLWIGAAPVAAVQLPVHVFLTNKRGFPALAKAHQLVLTSLLPHVTAETHRTHPQSARCCNCYTSCTSCTSFGWGGIAATTTSAMDTTADADGAVVAMPLTSIPFIILVVGAGRGVCKPISS
jgi:hypothetical protein